MSDRNQFEGITIPEGSGDHAAAMTGPATHPSAQAVHEAISLADRLCGTTGPNRDGGDLSTRVDRAIESQPVQRILDDSGARADRLQGRLRESTNLVSALQHAVCGLKHELAKHMSVVQYLVLCRTLGLEPDPDSSECVGAPSDIDHGHDTLADRVNRALRNGELS